MPYISELLNNQVTDSSDQNVGKLIDILIEPHDGSFAPLEFLAVKTPDKQVKFVPYDYVANFNSSKISLKNLFSKIALDALPGSVLPQAKNGQSSWVYLKRDILDHQIVDIAGTRVVRVNDLRIGSFDNKMCVLGIDSSVRGLMRRLGLPDIFFSWCLKVHLIDWRHAQLLNNGGFVQLNVVAENLGQLHPADLANIVEDLDVKHGSSLLASLDAKEAAKVLEEVDPAWQNILVKYLGPQKSSKILAQMSTDEIVDLVKSFSGEEAQALLSQVQDKRAASIQKLIAYPDNTAGGLMTLEFVTVRPNATVTQAIEEVKKVSGSLRSIVYIYVTEEDGRFVGVVSVRRLLTAGPDLPMRRLAKRLNSHSILRPEDSMRKIIRLMTRYNLYTAAVLDKDRRLAGIVTIDDVMRQLYPSA